MGENSNKKELKRQKRTKKEEKRNAARLYSHTQGVSFRVVGKFAKVFAAFGITRLARCSQGGNKAQLLQNHYTISLPNSLKDSPQALL